MAAADEILGISGQMDISDIQQSFDKLINDLNSLGVKTDEVSSKMTKALNDIAQSSASDSEKTKQSVQALKQGIEEINKSLTDTPEALKKLASEAQTAEATVDKLKKKLSETTEGSQKWNEINEQLKSQQNLVEKLNGEYSSMLGTFGSTQQYVGTLNAAIDTLNAGRSISTAATGANAAAHVGAAAAVGTEAVAHGENSTKIAEETEKTQQNTQAKLHLTESAKDYVYTTQMEAEAIDAVAKRLAEGRSDEEEYINSKKSGLAVRESLVQKIEEEKQKIKELSDVYANSQDTNNGVATPEVQKAYNEGVKEATDNIKEYRSELSSLNQSLDNLESSHFKAQQAINGQTDATQNLKQATEEAKDASDIYFNGEKATIEGVTEALKLDYQELKQLKAEYATYKGAGDTENAKKNLEEQKELNKHISEGREVLKQLGTSYEDAAKGAKKTKEETKEVAKSAEDATKKVGGIFSKFKNVLGGALKGDFSALFSLFGKIGIWGAALGTLGKGIYELTIRAEEFRNALQPLSHYLDESNLQTVRQNILSLSDETAKSVSDMAAAATQFVKVWDSLRDSPEALTTMIKTSNEFGALAGKTSEEGAKFLSNLASEYHMTAQDATAASAMIATAAHNSTSSFGEMADAISSAGSSAALYGVSFKEMATLIGYSSNQFGGAQKAASKFSMLLMSMSKMQDKYNPSVVGMITALQNLEDAYERGEHVENNFMARQRSIAMYFIKNADAIAKYNKGIDSNAAKQELLNDINARASVNVAKLQNSWNGFLTAINANLTPTLTRILNFFTKIIGGAQKTADELNYLKNFDNNHKGAKRGMRYTESVTSGWAAGFQESTIANMGARQQYNVSKEDGLKQYRQQRDKLKRVYQQGLKNAQRKWRNASGNAYAKSAGNFMLQYYNNNRSAFSEFTPQMFNELLRNQRSSTIALSNKPINTGINLGGNGYVPKPKKDRSADQQRNYREQLAEQQAKQLADDKRIEWELYVTEQEEGIAKEHDANEKELKQRKLDFEKKKHQIKEEAETLRQKNIQIAKAEYSKNPANKKKKGFYASGLDKNVKLTNEQQKLIDAKLALLNTQQLQYEREMQLQYLQSYREYLKEYGNLEQQKLAIVEEYNEKIKEARAKGNLFEEAKLKTDLEEQLKKLNFNDFKDSINWDSVFSDMGRLSKSYLKDLRKKLKDLLGSDTLDIDDMKVVSEQIGKIDDAISEQTDKWGWSNEKVREYNLLLQEAADAQERLNLAQGKLDKEQRSNENLKEYIQYIFRSKGVDVQTGDITSQNKENLLGNKSLFSEAELSKLKGLFDELAVSEVKVGKATKDVKKAQEDANVSRNKARKSINEIANEWAESIGNVAKKLQEASELIDALGFGDSDLGKKLKSGADAFNKGSQAASDFATGNYIGAAINGVGAIKSLGSALGIGNGSNAKEVAETTNRLTESNERLQYSIEQLKSSIDKTSGMSAVSNYQKAYDAQKQINKQSMEILQSQMGYHGSHHSNAYYWNLSAQDYAAINRTLAQQSAVRGGYVNSRINKVSSLEDIYKLTPEQMKDIRTYNQDVWKNMTDQGKYDKTEYWENYTDLAEKLEELTDKINQNLTQTTFDSLKDNFISNLMDMSKSAQDFANDFTTMLNKSMLNFAVDDLANKRLKALYEKWADKMKQGQLSNNDLDILKKEYDNIVDEGLKIRNNIAAMTGYKEAQSQQTATGKAIEAITADQASSLIGISYAMQIAQEQGNEVRKAIAVDISFLRIYTEQIYNNISEMRDIQYQGLEQLEAINKNTAPIILIREDIASMYKLMKDKY
uniref:Tape measure domain protein n=1 Tax=Siphoviridae sp. ctM5A27 TaxID=2825459 RepID=A0A8S5PF33_9CAUD|nr:MAG TPA: Tape measure domain protein [Siphoviridae sp. ctM5A27]